MIFDDKEQYNNINTVIYWNCDFKLWVKQQKYKLTDLRLEIVRSDLIHPKSCQYIVFDMPSALGIGRLKSLNRLQLANVIKQQVSNQLEDIYRVRIRRKDIISVYKEVNCIPIQKDGDVDNFAQMTRHLMNKALDNLINDAKKWNGRSLGNNLNGEVNKLCSHLLQSLMYTQLISEAQDHIGIVDIDVPLMARHLAEDVGALSNEKFGCVPLIQVEGILTVHAVPSLMRYSIFEILKNSIKATIDRYGVLNIDGAPGIVIKCNTNHATSGSEVYGSVEIVDYGTGMSDETKRR